MCASFDGKRFEEYVQKYGKAGFDLGSWSHRRADTMVVGLAAGAAGAIIFGTLGGAYAVATDKYVERKVEAGAKKLGRGLKELFS